MRGYQSHGWRLIAAEQAMKKMALLALLALALALEVRLRKKMGGMSLGWRQDHD